MTGMTLQNSGSAVKATQGAEAAEGATPDLGWAEAFIWTGPHEVGAGQRRQGRQMVQLGG